MQRYLEKLNAQKREFTNQLLAGDDSAREEIQRINDEIESLRPLDKIDQLNGVCAIIDKHIHSNYRIYPCNYIAYGQRFGTDRFNGMYSKEEADRFNNYLSTQLAKVQKEVDFTLSDEDYAFMRSKVIEMYSNPLINKLNATEGC